MERYQTQMRLPEIGLEGQEKLSQARALIIGLGGLGSALLPYLYRSGIGTLGLMDGDRVAESNLARQIMYTTSDIGRLKVDCAQKFLAQDVQENQVFTYPQFLDYKQGISVMSKYDLVVDCTDNLAARYCMNDLSLLLGIPMIYGSVYQFQGQISVFNYQGGPSFRGAFEENQNTCIDCNQGGVLGATVAQIALMQANEIYKIILGLDKVLSGELLLYDTLNYQIHRFHIPKTEKCTQVYAEERVKAHQSEVWQRKKLGKEDAPKEVIYLDVRSLGEGPLLPLDNRLQIPLSELTTERSELSSRYIYKVFCQSGFRSKVAVERLQQRKDLQVVNVEGGIYELLNQIKE